MSHFNSIANQWDTPEKIKQNKSYAELIKKHLTQLNSISILEVGCGTGLLGGEFLSDENHLLGLDTSTGMLEVFNQKYINHKATSMLLNLEEHDLPADQKFDLILSAMAFHHLKNPLTMLSKLSSHLKTKGTIVVIDLDQEDGTFHPDPKNMGVHHFGFNEEQTKAWCLEAQLTKLPRQIVNIVHKNEKQYPIFLEIFTLREA